MDKIKMTLYYAYSHSADIVQDDGRIIESRLHYNVLVVNGVNFFGETEEMELNIGEENTNIFRFQFLHSFKINGIIFGVFLSDEKEENLIIKIQDILESHNHSDFSLQDHDIEEIFDFELKKITSEQFENDYSDGLNNFDEPPNIYMPEFDVEDLIQKYIGTSDSESDEESDEESD
jgi:hypothetical protein